MKLNISKEWLDKMVKLEKEFFREMTKAGKTGYISAGVAPKLPKKMPKIEPRNTMEGIRPKKCQIKRINRVKVG